MNPIVIAAAALPVLFGVALAVVSIADRRRAALRQRIGQGMGLHVARPAAAAGETLRLDSGANQNLTGSFGLLPPALVGWIQAELGATGDRTKVWHLVLAGCVGALLAAIMTERLLGLASYIAVPLTVAAALGLPIAFVRFMQGRYQTAFLHAFPDGLDLIVRALRAGLPVTDAIETVGTEIGGPVGGEFRSVRDGVTIGIDLEQALTRAARRIRLIEFHFFIMALQLQRRTGGNLAETLENLALTIRRRKEVWLKARALTSESRASAWLIGILPFVGSGAIYVINPYYISLLFTDPRGKTVLGVAIGLLATGVLIMRTMIKRAAR